MEYRYELPGLRGKADVRLELDGLHLFDAESQQRLGA
jgi:hypothetical protein